MNINNHYINVENLTRILHIEQSTIADRFDELRARDYLLQPIFVDSMDADDRDMRRDSINHVSTELQPDSS